MKIPTDLDPKPPFEEFWPRTPPPLKEFPDPPLEVIIFLRPPPTTEDMGYTQVPEAPEIVRLCGMYRVPEVPGIVRLIPS